MKQNIAKQAPVTLVAHLLLAAPAFPDLDRISAMLAGLHEITWEPPVSQDGITTQRLQLDEEPAGITLVPFPLPWSELEAPCSASLHWQDAAAMVTGHVAHLIVEFSSRLPSAPDRNLALTRLTAAAAEATGALAVYWSDGQVIHSCDRFLRLAARADRAHPPIPLWVGAEVTRHPAGGLCIATTGMEALGLCEIECRTYRLSPRQLAESVYQLAGDLYAASSSSGGVSRAAGGQELARGVYRPSVWDRPGQVLFVELDGPEPLRRRTGIVIDLATRRRLS